MALPKTLNQALQATASITVTELYNEGRSAANDPTEYPLAEISEVLDKRTCPLCQRVDGMILQVGSPEYAQWRQPSHINCFPAGVLVSGPRAVASSARWYVGELVEIVTANGNFLPVTPNHPILTPKGWIAAGLLNERDYVVCRRSGERVNALVNPDDNQVPAQIEQVAETLGGYASVITIRVPVSAEDFHGDGGGSEVCVIRANRLLYHRLHATLGKPVPEKRFVRRRMGLTLLASSGAPASALERISVATAGHVSRRRIATMLLGSAGGHCESIGFGATPHRNASSAQAAFDDDSSCVKCFRKRAHRLSILVAAHDLCLWKTGIGAPRCRALQAGDSLLRHSRPEQSAISERVAEGYHANLESARGGVVSITGDVCLDRIVQIRRRGFRGHVYNLETTSGWYAANGIITHNCRRILSYISKDEVDVEADFKSPDPELIRKHGHYHIDPEKHAALRVPAEPAGRHFVVRRVRDLETGELKTVLDWAPWHDQLTQEQKRLILGIRATNDEAALQRYLAELGITDMNDPEHLRRAALFGVRDRIEGWITLAEPARIDRVLAGAESRLAKGGREKVAVYGQDGKKLLEKEGDMDRVTLTRDETVRLRGSVIVHNHPSGVGFSPDDIRIAATYGAAEVRVVVRIGKKTIRYSMQPPDTGWSREFWEKTIAPLEQKYAAEVSKELGKKSQNGIITKEDFYQQFWHEIWERVARSAGLHYRRE